MWKIQKTEQGWEVKSPEGIGIYFAVHPMHWVEPFSAIKWCLMLMY